MSKNKRGRPTIGTVISVNLTEEQLQWIESQVVPGRLNRSEVIRRIVDQVMNAETR